MKTSEIYYLKHRRKHSLFLIIDLTFKTIRIIRTKTGFISKLNKANKRHLKKHFINSENYKLISRTKILQKLQSKNMTGILPPVQTSLFSNQLELNY